MRRSRRSAFLWIFDAVVILGLAVLLQREARPQDIAEPDCPGYATRWIEIPYHVTDETLPRAALWQLTNEHGMDPNRCSSATVASGGCPGSPAQRGVILQRASGSRVKAYIPSVCLSTTGGTG